MISVDSSIVGTSLILSITLAVGEMYSVSVQSYNQETITLCSDQSSQDYPLYLGSTGVITPGYLSPNETFYLTFNGTSASIVPQNPLVQVYTLPQAESAGGSSGYGIQYSEAARNAAVRKKGIIIPYYYYPDNGSTTSNLEQIIYTRSQFPELEWFIIMNPDSGPGASIDPNYTQAINICRAYDLKVLGYVGTNTGTIPAETINSNVDTWMQFYTIDGVFFDNFPYTYTAARASIYEDIYNYAKFSQNLSWVFVNPGTSPETEYFTGNKMWDCLNIWETNSYPTSEEDLMGDYAYFYRNQTQRYSGIVYSQPSYNIQDAAVLNQYCSLVYVTDANNYNRVPLYLAELATSLTSVGMSTLSLYSSGSPLSSQSVNSTATSGGLVITAEQLVAGIYIDSATQTSAFTFTTDTASNIIQQLPNAVVGSSFRFRFLNNDQSSTGYQGTLAGGEGVTVSTLTPNPSINQGAYMDYLFSVTGVGSSPSLTVYAIGGGGTA